MKITILLNGISPAKKKFYRTVLPPLQRVFEVHVRETQYAGHARQLAREADSDIVLAAGGDGTLHEVINGVMERPQQPVVGILPLGSGNDFARTCGLRADPQQLIDLIQARSFKPTDVGQVELYDRNGQQVTRYFINACSVGMGPQVLEILQQRSRRWGAGFNYFTAIVQTFFTYRYQNITLKTETAISEKPVRVLAIANGRSFGNRLTIAPTASVQDGLLNVFTAARVSLFDFLRLQGKLKSGKTIEHPQVHYQTCAQAWLTADEPAAMEADGEWAGLLPARINVLRGKILFCRQ